MLLTKTGNFIGLDNLEELRLIGCSTLKELDSSVGCLQKLVELDLVECPRLERFPWEIIGKLTSLHKLNLFRCSNLREISHEVGSLISLQYLNLRNTRLHQLTEIDLSYCTNLKSIPDLPPSIKELKADGCKNLVNLPSNCSELQFLTELTLNDCCKLGSEGFTQVTRLRNLQKLYMINCNISQVSSGIGNFVSLRVLYLKGNTFSSLPESFSNLSKLERLDIGDCSELQLLPPIPSKLEYIEAINCGSLNLLQFDSKQKAYIFRSKVFKESLTSTEGLCISLSGAELPEWCTYRNNGNVLSFVAPIQFDSKICGLILCATKDENNFKVLVYPTIYNKTKGTSHQFRDRGYGYASKMVMFYPLDDTTLVVEAGDSVEVEFYDKWSVLSCGLHLVYEDDVVD